MLGVLGAGPGARGSVVEHRATLSLGTVQERSRNGKTKALRESLLRFGDTIDRQIATGRSGGLGDGQWRRNPVKPTRSMSSPLLAAGGGEGGQGCPARLGVGGQGCEARLGERGQGCPAR